MLRRPWCWQRPKACKRPLRKGLSVTRQGQWLASGDAITLETARRGQLPPRRCWAQPSPLFCSRDQRGPGKPAPIGDAAGDCRHCLRLRPEEREKAWGSGSDGPNAGDGAGEAAVLPTVAHAPHVVGTGEMVTNASFLCTTEGREEV